MSTNERFDMFDVAEGKCELVEFLLTRFSPLDLQTRIALDPKANVVEHLAPPPKPPDPPPAPLFPTFPTFPTVAVEEVGATPLPAAQASEAEAPPQDPADIQKLIATFHQAAKVYNQSTSWDDPENADASGGTPPQ